MLGHAALATTEVYTRVGVTKFKAVHTDSHPARPAGARGGAGKAQTPGDALFAALDAEGVPSP